jgi:hypothetical protein
MTDGALMRAEFAGRDATIRMATSAYSVIHATMHDLTALPEQVNEADQLELEAFLSALFSYHLDKRVVSRTFDVMR